MMRLGELGRRLAFLLQRKKHLEELDEEMQLHADLRARALERPGTTPAGAASEVKRQFGNRTILKEQSWDVWSLTPVENAWRDVRFAGRLFGKDLSFTAMAMLTLALGIGATTAMFSVIDNVLLEPFPYADQQRLVSLEIHDLENSEVGARGLFPAAEFLDYQEQNRVFEDVMGVGISRAVWSRGEVMESINAPVVTANAFEFLGVPPVLGRWAGPSDVKPRSPAVCVMSYSFWQSRFAGDRAVLGKLLILDGTPTTVVGVMPPRFVFWSGDVWLPTALRHETAGFPPPWFYLLGRLKPGLTLQAADQQIQVVAEHLAGIYRPNLYPYRFNAKLQTFADSSVGKFRQTLLTLLAAVGLLLLIACANVANLLLAKGSARKREFAIRVSLGAGWSRVMRQLFAESGILALLGAGAGCLLAWAGLKVLMTVLPRDTFPDEAVIGLNLHVLAATVAVAVSVALFFGLVPAIGGLRRDVSDALKSGEHEDSRFRGARLRNLLVVVEVAMALVLLATAGAMMRSFLRERQVQLGLNPQRLLTAQIFLTKGHRTVEQQARFRRELTSALRRVPGIVEVTTTSDFPPFGGAATEFAFPAKPHSLQYDGQVAMIDSSLFRTLQVPFLRGRNLTETDLLDRRMIAIVNQAFVRKFFRDEDPIGRQVQVTTLAYLPEPLRNPWFEIGGVVADFKNRGLRHPVVPEIFVANTISGLGGFSLVLRTAGDPTALGRLVEGTALRLDRSAVIRKLRSMEDGLESEEYAKPRFSLEIFWVFASLGLILAAGGLYSLMSYTASQRKREMGIRLALGATPAQVQALVIKGGMRFVIAGILVGLFAAFIVLRVIQNQLWGISTQDPVTFLAAVGALFSTGVVACYIPSRSALRVDPAVTLRSE